MSGCFCTCLTALGTGLRQTWQKILAEGLAPRQLGLAIAIGVTIGILPTPWGTSLICFGLAWLLGLNQVAMQAANYLVYPLQISLFLPYSALARWLLPGWFKIVPPLSFDLVSSGRAALGDTLVTVQLSALTGWALTAPLLLGGIYLLAITLCRSFGDAGKACTDSAVL